MLIDRPGKITEGLYLIGTGQNLIYLVHGKKNMIIGGAMNSIAPQLEKQFSLLNLDPFDIKYLVIQHSHFDHVGAIPYLKRKFPHIKVLGTLSSKKILSNKKVLDYIQLVNTAMIDQCGLRDQYEKLNLEIDAINVDEIVNDSTIIDLGNSLNINFIETPGHSPCALSVYIPKLKAIFPSDSAPFPLGSIDKLTNPSPQYDYNLYKKSLKKLLNYEIEICGFDHYAAVTGKEARQVLINGLKLCEQFEKHIQSLYHRFGDIDKVSEMISRETIELTRFNFVNEEVLLPVSNAVVNNILKSSGINSDQ